MREDIGEQNDLSLTEPKIKEKLTTLLHSWRKDVKAQMPQQNPNYDADPSQYPPGALEGGLTWNGYEIVLSFNSLLFLALKSLLNL